jgi:cobalt-zinc-cadmium efflux system protein
MSSMANEHLQSHSHHHHSARENYDRAFAIGIGLNAAVVVLEVIFGISSHSLALLSDAGHNLTDVLGLVLAGAAAVLGRRRPTTRRTYGLRRSSILAALFNALFLLIIVVGIGYEAINRLSRPEAVQSEVMIIVAAVGMFLNAGTAFLFRRDHHDINLRAAYVHMAGDALISLGVVIAGVVMHFTKWLWLDPAISLVIGVAIAYSTWEIFRESFNLAVDAVPAGIDRPEVEQYFQSLPDVSNVHDLHIWGMSTTETALTVHLVTEHERIDNSLLQRVTRDLHERFGIDHPTVQIEARDESHECELRDPAHV